MLLCKNDTKYFTQTRDGRIPHLNAKIGGFNLTMPVKLKPDSHGSVAPMRDRHGYIYALPGNRQINLNGDIT